MGGHHDKYGEELVCEGVGEGEDVLEVGEGPEALVVHFVFAIYDMCKPYRLINGPEAQLRKKGVRDP